MENEQIQEISAVELRLYGLTEERHPLAVPRGGPDPTYNCHGLVFAARRTGIFELSQLTLALNEDQYEQVGRHEVLPGDIVLYISDEGDIEHSGIVVSEPDPQLGIPRIVSKWGKGREVVHMLADCPYTASNVRYYRVSS